MKPWIAFINTESATEMRFCETEEEALRQTRLWLAEERDEAIDGWDPSIENGSIGYAKIAAQSKETSRERKDEEDERPDYELLDEDFLVDYDIVKLTTS